MEPTTGTEAHGSNVHQVDVLVSPRGWLLDAATNPRSDIGVGCRPTLSNCKGGSKSLAGHRHSGKRKLFWPGHSVVSTERSLDRIKLKTVNNVDYSSYNCMGCVTHLNNSAICYTLTYHNANLCALLVLPSACIFTLRYTVREAIRARATPARRDRSNTGAILSQLMLHSIPAHILFPIDLFFASAFCLRSSVAASRAPHS
eukprot:6199535-Pleurochrysis_carterae.AAC.1